MLRASSDHLGQALELRGVADLGVDSKVSAAAEIMAAVDAAVLRDHYEIDDARSALVDRIGEPAAVRVFAIAGNFEMMNRLLDAIGAPVGKGVTGLADEMGLTIPDHLQP